MKLNTYAFIATTSVAAVAVHQALYYRTLLNEQNELFRRLCHPTSTQQKTELKWQIDDAYFGRFEVLGKGGQKVAYIAGYHLKKGEIWERQEDWVWVETAAKNAKGVLAGYELAKSLPSHPHIHRTHQWKEEEGCVIAIEPRCTISLDRVVLPWKVMVRCMKQVAQAVVFLHENRVLHKDLKPANIFLRVTPEGIIALIADFDVARKLENKTFTDHHMAGTPQIQPPECEKKEDYDLKADVWALALLLFDQIWHSATCTVRTIPLRLPKDNLKLDWPDQMGEGGKALCEAVKKGLNSDQKDRCNSKEFSELIKMF